MSGLALRAPCHRVIRESRENGHYLSVSERKNALLAYESASAHP